MNRTRLSVFAILAAALALRVIEAHQTYLNPDEISYFFMSVAESFPQLHQQSLHTHHPPLLVFLLHLVGKISTSELALRSIPVMAGVAFPWLIYRWLELIWNEMAGFVALVILCFAPHLVSLSAQARGYTLALLGISASLYWLELAIERHSGRFMIASGLALYGAILSEYFVAFYAPAAGIYFLLRAWGLGVPRRLWAVWVATQAGGVGLYGVLYVTHIRGISDSRSSEAALKGFLRGGFLQPGENPLVFFLVGCLKQLAYLFASIPLGAVMALVFAAGIYLLWRGRYDAAGARERAVVALLLLPFLFAAAAAFLEVHPFGRSRHTVLLSMLAAVGVSIALERLCRGRAPAAAIAAVALVPLWLLTAREDANNIPAFRHGQADMVRSVEHLRASLPAGSPLLTDGETKSILSYYLGPSEEGWDSFDRSSTEWNNHFRLVSYRYTFVNAEQLLADADAFRAEYQLAGRQIWVVDGGWDILPRRLPKLRTITSGRMDTGNVLDAYKLLPSSTSTSTSTGE